MCWYVKIVRQATRSPPGRSDRVSQNSGCAVQRVGRLVAVAELHRCTGAFVSRCSRRTPGRTRSDSASQYKQLMTPEWQRFRRQERRWQCSRASLDNGWAQAIPGNFRQTKSYQRLRSFGGFQSYNLRFNSPCNKHTCLGQRDILFRIWKRYSAQPLKNYNRYISKCLIWGILAHFLSGLRWITQRTKRATQM